MAVTYVSLGTPVYASERFGVHPWCLGAGTIFFAIMSTISLLQPEGAENACLFSKPTDDNLKLFNDTFSSDDGKELVFSATIYIIRDVYSYIRSNDKPVLY